MTFINPLVFAFDSNPENIEHMLEFMFGLLVIRAWKTCLCTPGEDKVFFFSQDNTSKQPETSATFMHKIVIHSFWSSVKDPGFQCLNSLYVNSPWLFAFLCQASSFIYELLLIFCWLKCSSPFYCWRRNWLRVVRESWRLVSIPHL